MNTRNSVSARRRLAFSAACSIGLSGAVAGCGGDDDEGSASTGSSSLDGQGLVFVNYGGESATAAKAAWNALRGARPRG